MNSRKLYREYLKSKGCDCKEFIRLDEDYYSTQTITYKDSGGRTKTANICVKQMLLWVFKSFDDKIWEGYHATKHKNKDVKLFQGFLEEISSTLECKLANPINVYYKVHKLGDGEYEVLEKVVDIDHTKYNDYDDDGLSCFESLDLDSWIEDNYKCEVGEELSFTLQIKFDYWQDYSGDWDMDWEVRCE